MPRGRKRPARSQRRVEPRTTSREPVGRSKRRRPATRRRSVRQSASSRSSSSCSDWSSSRERRESKRRREIAVRARANEPPKHKSAPRSSKKAKNSKKVPNPKKPGSSADTPGDEQENDFSVVHRRKSTENNEVNNASAGPRSPNQPGPSCSPPPEEVAADVPEDAPEGTVPCCIPRCPWRGTPDTLSDHVDAEHASLMLYGDTQQFEVPVTDSKRGAALSRVVRAFNEMFAVHFRRPPNANQLLGCVQLLGPPERACDFVYQMEVRDENGEICDPPLQHCPLIANTSSSREFDIAETLKQVCISEQAGADSENEPKWGDREVITVEVKISTSTDCEDLDDEATTLSPPPELSFMWT